MSHLYQLIILPIEYLIEYIYVFMARRFGSAGVAIIAVSLVINILILPIYRRADAIQEEERDKQAGMKKWMDRIRQAFHGDEKVMMLNTYYREQDYRPVYALRGLFPLLLQIPFFIAAYHFLSEVADLSGHGFWILSDLGLPDGLIRVGNSSWNLLPVLMTVINVISGVLYLRGFPLKSKLQHYALAAFFLFFLYQSPSGLVLYWTLNNLFSLIKNLLMKYVKKPRLWLDLGMAVIGFVAFGYLWINGRISRMTDLVYAAVILLISLFPMLLSIVSKLLGSRKKTGEKQIKRAGVPMTDGSSFLMAQVFLTLLYGAVIPMSVIASSPTEFVDVANYNTPMHHIFSNLCVTGGVFLLWGSIIYYFIQKEHRRKFVCALQILSVVSVINYMLFGKKLGTLSPQLVFDGDFRFEMKVVVINVLVLIMVVILQEILRQWTHVVLR